MTMQDLQDLFRLSDPRDLSAVQTVCDTIAANEAPLAYTFVNQVPDGPPATAVKYKLSVAGAYFCNRVSGPGSEDDA